MRWQYFIPILGFAWLFAEEAENPDMSLQDYILWIIAYAYNGACFFIGIVLYIKYGFR